MPFLHRDNGRGGGGSKENRRSWGNFANLDSPQSAGPASGPINEHHSNEGGGGSGNASGPYDWRWSDWEVPASPEAALSPISSVPATCFPPQHPTAFTSYSEGACSGDWSNDVPDEITDLTASLKTLSVASTSASGSHGSSQQYGQERLSYKVVEKNVEPPWPPEQSPTTKLNTLPNIGLISRGREDVLRWSGALPPRAMDSRSGYSPKVFLGGLPWDITEETLMQVFNMYRPVRVEWPGREGQSGGTASGGGNGEYSPRGYAYVTFESERCVRTLLAAVHCDGFNWFYRISSRNARGKEVQVIPWAVSDSNWVLGGSARLEPTRTVFVGALHGMISAYALAIIMNDLFSGVIYAGIDTDKNKYPIGSGRVTFDNVHSYVRAVSAGYVEISTNKFTKTVQVDPYLEDSICSSCNIHQGPYFCRDPACFRYFCRSCWAQQHHGVNHKQLMRNSRGAYNGALVSQFMAPSDVGISIPAGLAPSRCRRPSKQFTHDATKNTPPASAQMVDANDHGAALPPVTVTMHQQTASRAQTHAVVSGQTYHNGYKNSSAGTPSQSPTGSSDFEVAAESFSQRSM